MPIDIRERPGCWIATASGNRFYPLDPRAEEVFVLDIARALSHCCRYNGHTPWPYSVAQHSVLVSQRAAMIERMSGLNGAIQRSARWGLLHDAAEAYVGDIVWPIKQSGAATDLLAAEEAILDVIADRYHLPKTMPLAVKQADREVLLAEVIAFWPGQTWGADRVGFHPETGEKLEPWPREGRIVQMEAHVAAREFLGEFAELFGEPA